MLTLCYIHWQTSYLYIKSHKVKCVLKSQWVQKAQDFISLIGTHKHKVAVTFISEFPPLLEILHPFYTKLWPMYIPLSIILVWYLFEIMSVVETTIHFLTDYCFFHSIPFLFLILGLLRNMNISVCRRGKPFVFCGRHSNLLSKITWNSVLIRCKYGKDSLSTTIPNAILLDFYLIDVLQYISQSFKIFFFEMYKSYTTVLFSQCLTQHSSLHFLMFQDQ